MKSPETFWNNLAARYAARPIGDPAAYQTSLTRTRAFLKPDDNVLEVGCGTGSTALLLAPDVGHITGTDLSTEMIRIAQSKARAEKATNVTFTRAAIDAAPIRDGRYDVVLAFNILHLVQDLNGALQDIRAQLKPGGIFISKTACIREKSPLIPLVIGAMRLVGKAPYVNCFRQAYLDQAILAAGFQTIELGNYPATSRFIVARKP